MLVASNVDAREPRMLQDIVGWYDGGDNPLEIVEDDVDPIALPSLQTEYASCPPPGLRGTYLNTEGLTTRGEIGCNRGV